MAFAWIFSLVLFVGATSALQLNAVAASNPAQKNTLSAFPSIVQVESYVPWGAWRQTCAASILNTRYVLSAAYCFAGPGYQDYYRRIRAGAINRETGGVINYVLEAHNYQRGNITNQTFTDITVVRLANAIVYSPVIRPTTIPQVASFIPNGLSFVQVGWGSDRIRNALSVTPSFTVPSNACGIAVLPQNSSGNVLCANFAGGFINSIVDIGSPWLFGNITIGVVSGINYGIGSWNGIISASVASYTDWILRTAV